MTKEDYINMSEGLTSQIVFVAERAREIIRSTVAELADDKGIVTKEKLYGDTDDPDYVELDTFEKSHLVSLCINETDIVLVGTASKYSTMDNHIDYTPIWYFGPLDLIAIADHIVEL